MHAVRPLLLTCLCIAAVAAIMTLSDRPVQACCPRPVEVISDIDEYTTAADRALAENPTDPDQLYVCARAHLYAAVHRCQQGSMSSYNELNDFASPVTPGTYLSPAQATAHYRRAMELLAQLETIAPERTHLYIARAYLLEHCSRDLDLLPADLSPLAPADTARWQTTVNDLGNADAATRHRALTRLTRDRALVLPVLRDNLDNPILGIRTQVRELVRSFWQDEAIANYRRAFDQFTAAARAEHRFDSLEYAQERILCGDAVVRLVHLRTATADETSFIRQYSKLHKKLARQIEQEAVPQPCMVED